VNGLCRYNEKSDDFTRINLNIPNNNICCILEYQNTLWISTSNGLIKYKNNKVCRIYTKHDGLHCSQFIPNSGIKTIDNKMYFGTIDGFISFYPYNITTNKKIPPVYITNIKLFNKDLKIGSKILHENSSTINQLELKNKDKVFSIMYSALSYCYPDNNQYTYKLVGFDKKWNDVGSQNQATYTNLPSGTYTFRVKGSNNDGIWNDRGASLKIIVHPPFYFTFFFKTLYLLILLLLLWLFIRYLLLRSSKKNDELIRQININTEKEVQNSKLEFFTMIAHDIRTPVSLIIGPIEKILNNKQNLSDDLLEDLNIINRNSNRLLSLINQLLDFRKINNEKNQIIPTNQNIANILRDIAKQYDTYINNHDIKFTIDYPDATFTANIDKEAFIKIVSNLLANAFKYTINKVKLTCKISKDKNEFIILVSDNGKGVNKTEASKIFDSFYQGKNKKSGTGIGLYIVKSYVEAHHGHIEIESSEETGATFKVFLPIKQTNLLKLEDKLPKEINTEEETNMSISGTSKLSILIVDDNADMLYFLSRSFNEEYNIMVAKNGKEALRILNKEEVSIIISDWIMPIMNGIELCKKIRSDKILSHIPFILLTAKTETQSKIMGINCGADLYIEKPFSIKYLRTCIKNLLDLRSQLRDKFSKMPLCPINSISSNYADKKFLDNLNKIIEDNFSNSNLSVDFLAERLFISRSGLFSKIKNLANITPNELIQLVRLKKAASLLVDNKYRVNEISYMVGFNNPSYFSKCFQKQFGVKPIDFVSDYLHKTK